LQRRRRNHAADPAPPTGSPLNSFCLRLPIAVSQTRNANRRSAHESLSSPQHCEKDNVRTLRDFHPFDSAFGVAVVKDPAANVSSWGDGEHAARTAVTSFCVPCGGLVSKQKLECAFVILRVFSSSLRSQERSFVLRIPGSPWPGLELLRRAPKRAPTVFAWARDCRRPQAGVRQSSLDF